jgi:transposase
MRRRGRGFAVDGEGLGRSRGGLSIKIHTVVDGRGPPMRILITPGQAGDDPRLLPLLDGIRVARPGPGHQRVRLEAVIVDKPYSRAEPAIAAFVLWLR